MTATRPERPAARGAELLALTGLLALAAVLRLHGLDAAPVWVDEANSILTAKLPLAAIVEQLGRDSSPPLFYLLLHFWLRAFGDGEVALRAFSSLVGLALVGAVHAVGSRTISARAGLWGAGLVAIAPVAIFHSQQVRMYALLPLLALLSMFFLLAHLQSGRARSLAGWWVATIAALYAHNVALHLLPAQAALILVSGRLRERLPALALAALAGAAVYAPWLPSLLQQVGNPDHYAWYLPLWERRGPWGAILDTLRSFSPGAEYALYHRVGAPTWWQLPALVTAGLAVLGAVALGRHRRDWGRARAWWLPLSLGIPVGSALVLSSVTTPHYVASRVDQLVFPTFALLVGAGLATLRPGPVQPALALGLLAVALASKPSLYPDYRPRGFAGSDRELAAALAEEWRPGDAILCTSLSRASLAYYLGRRGIDAPILSYPRDTARHLGAQNDARLLADPVGLRREAESVLQEARRRLGGSGRLFLVRERAPVNRWLGARVLARSGWARIRSLGRFAQAGTGSTLEVEIHRPRREEGLAPPRAPHSME